MADQGCTTAPANRNSEMGGDLWGRHRIGRAETLVGVVVILLAAFGLRLYRLGEPSLWNDEGLTLYRARAPWVDVLRGRIVLQGNQPIETIDNHPPLYFSLLKPWVTLAGDSEFALRFPSAGASLLLIPLFWAIWKRLKDPLAAWIAAILLALSPLYLWYGQEARMYTLLALEVVLLLWFLLPTNEGPARRPSLILIMAGLMLAMLLTHYTAILWFLSLGIWAALEPERRSRSTVLPILLFIFAASTPFLPFFYQRLLSGPERDYRFVPLSTLLVDALRAPAFGTSFPWVSLGAMALGAWHLWRRFPSVARLAAFSFLGPLLLLYGLSHVKPLYQNIRHLFLITPFTYLLASAGLAAAIRRYPWIGIAASGWIGVGMLLSDWRYFSEPYPLKDDWRDALAWVSERAMPQDLVILQDLTLTPLAGYYYRGPAPLRLTTREGGGEQEALVRGLEVSPQKPERIWLIVGLSQEDLSRPDQALFHWLSTHSRYLTQNVFPSRNIWIRVLVYEAYPVDDPPSPHAIRVDLALDPYLRLRWLEGPESAGSILRWWFFWERGAASSINLWLRIQLADETGTVWAEEVQPIWPSYPPERWPEGQLVRQQVRLNLPPGLPPGTYRLRLEAFDLDRRILANGAPTWTSPPFLLDGHTRLALPIAPPARSRAGLLLLAAQPEVDPPYFPGLALPVRLLWQAEATPPAARSLALFWQQGTDRRLLFRGDVGPLFFPTARWQAGQVIAQRILLPLPPDLRGYGQIRMALYDAEGREIPWETLWPFHRTSRPVLALALSPWPVRRKPIPLASKGQACFEAQVCLDRYEIVPGQAAPGQIVEVRLAWHVHRRPQRPGTVFVHLGREPEQPPLATGDAPPQEGRRPILTWEPGEYVEDTHRLSLPAELPPGRYRIFIGWYSEEGRWRATDPSGARYPMDAVPIGEIEVRP